MAACITQSSPRMSRLPALGLRRCSGNPGPAALPREAPWPSHQLVSPWASCPGQWRAGARLGSVLEGSGPGIHPEEWAAQWEGKANVGVGAPQSDSGPRAPTLCWAPGAGTPSGSASRLWPLWDLGVWDWAASLVLAPLALAKSLLEATWTGPQRTGHLRPSEPQAPVTLSPCGLDRGWEPPAWRPVSCQEDVLSPRPALGPPPSLRPPGAEVGASWGGGALEAGQLPPWVPSPACLSQLPLPQDPDTGDRGPSPAPGVFRDRLQSPPRGNKGWRRRGEVGRKAKKWGLTTLGHSSAGCLPHVPSCLGPVWGEAATSLPLPLGANEAHRETGLVLGAPEPSG